ncbi:patatin-like phospholipase family protein [Flavobacteriaceae bacterium F08102]|nr:patatin-like phospholipase family protein [Flavobacteriaceae bacterium F08102]
MKQLIFLLVCLCTLQGHAQKREGKDLKVGLVLSGGGAKGFAHVGVLKVLEEAGVRIDYIGGTSMGAIIGALYASGYSAKKLDSIIRSVDFNDLMQDRIPRKSKSIYQKENTEKYALTLPIKNGGITLPSAISKGQNIFNLLSQLTISVQEVDDFSKLPIPFFCMATNLENGKSEVLEKGFLPQAVRASGSFPTLLDPVEIDGKLLTDGGVLNNFPVDVMQEKGVDLIIGVDVQDGLKDRSQLNSALEIVMQLINFQIYSEDNLKVEETDVYIKPDINSFNVVSFNDMSEIINKGVVAANKHLEELKLIASQQVNKPFKKAVNTNTTYKINGISFSGNENYTQRYMLGKLKFDRIDTISHERFIEGINNLSATGNFKNIQYRFIPKEDGVELHFDVKESEIATYFQLGIHYDDVYKTGVLLNLTSKHLMFKNDLLSTDLVLGDFIRFNADYFIDNGFHWSYGVNMRYNEFKRSFFESRINEAANDETEDETIGEVPFKYKDFTSQVFVQTNFDRKFAVRLGAEVKSLSTSFETLVGGERVKEFVNNTNYVNAFGSVLFDSYDHKNFPTKGMFFNADYRAYLSASKFDADFKPFSQLKGKLAGAFSFGDFTTQIETEAGVTMGEGSQQFDFFLGGNNKNYINNFINFYGYKMADLSERNFLKSSVTFRYELFNKNYLSFTANAARAASNLINEGAIFDNTRTGYAVGYSLDSFLGPIELRYTWSPDTNQNYWFLNAGFWF